MRRRFLAAAAALLLAPVPGLGAEASMRRLGILGIGDAQGFLEGVGKGKVLAALAVLGYQRGRNLEVDERYAEGRRELLTQAAAQLVALKVDAILTEGTVGTLIAQQATRTIPIVTTVGDPVMSGFARELARPGGNVTGISQNRTLLAAKQVEMLRAVSGPLSGIAVLYYRDVPGVESLVKPLVDAIRAAGIAPLPMDLNDDGEDEAVLKACAARGIRAAISLGSGGTPAFAQAAIKHRVAVVVVDESQVPFGAIGSVQNDSRDDYNDLAAILDKVFRGANPGEIPFSVAKRVRTVLNAKTAAALGLKIPDTLRLQADRVIE